MNRKQFIRESAALITAAGLLQQCNQASALSIKGTIAGANHAAGHLLRDATILSKPSTQTTNTGTLIIGGGVSGLSAGRWLKKNGQDNFLLIELDEAAGGNAAAGKNEVSAYPWGAHYIPLPNNDLVEYNAFLADCGVITGYENGLPVINDYYLCFAPQERLYINGRWQEGIIPEFGVPVAEQDQTRRFLAEMNKLRHEKDLDGKDAFAIPAAASSTDETYTSLDKVTMKEWLQKNGYTSPHLHWYVNYCCRDDFGSDYSRCSAWAGIHYFAGRKGLAANAPPQSVITWPEGNSWLIQQLKKDFTSNILTGTIALSISSTGQGVAVKVIDVNTKHITTIHATNCIVATPQFISSRLLKDEARQKETREHFIYQPWMVANITTSALKERLGAEPGWDNVLFKGKALGYVEATHQQTALLKKQKVLTYYLPLTENTAEIERQRARIRSHKDWIQIILADLANAHPDLAIQATRADIWVWGHAMISPVPGFIHGKTRLKFQQPIDNSIFFAHTDLAGISIFEEGFYQGIQAATQILKKR